MENCISHTHIPHLMMMMTSRQVNCVNTICGVQVTGVMIYIIFIIFKNLFEVEKEFLLKSFCEQKKIGFLPKTDTKNTLAIYQKISRIFGWEIKLRKKHAFLNHHFVVAIYFFFFFTHKTFTID